MDEAKLKVLLNYYGLEKYYPDLLTIGITTLEDFAQLTSEQLVAIRLETGTSDFILMTKIVDVVAKRKSAIETVSSSSNKTTCESGVAANEESDKDNIRSTPLEPNAFNSENVKVCPSCGAPIHGEKYCTKCGAALIKRCVKCGTKMFVSDLHCKKCGFDNSNESRAEVSEHRVLRRKKVRKALLILLCIIYFLQVVSMIWARYTLNGYAGVDQIYLLRDAINGEGKDYYVAYYIQRQGTSYNILAFLYDNEMNSCSFSAIPGLSTFLETGMSRALPVDLEEYSPYDFDYYDELRDKFSAIVESSLSDYEALINRQTIINFKIHYKPFWLVLDTSLQSESPRGISKVGIGRYFKPYVAWKNY